MAVCRVLGRMPVQEEPIMDDSLPTTDCPTSDSRLTVNSDFTTGSSTLGISRTKSVFSLATASATSSLASSSVRSQDTVEGNSSNNSHHHHHHHQMLIENLPDTFGRDLREYTQASPDTPLLDSGLRRALEPHLRTARQQRERVRRNISGSPMDAHIASSLGVPYPELRTETPFLFPEDTYPLHRMLADCLQISDLAQAHQCGGSTDEEILAPLRDPQQRIPFQKAYDSFVVSFCIPFLHSIALSKGLFHSATATDRVTYRYQAFPHIDISRPNDGSAEFPSTCTCQGKSLGSLSFHVPLTPAFGTNARYTESHPGREDWHPLRTTAIGLGYLYDSARCLSYTMENTTDATRIALDFTVLLYYNTKNKSCDLPGGGGKSKTGLCPPNIREDAFSRAGPGFYREATVPLGPNHHSELVQRIPTTPNFPPPDHRCGLPF